MFDFNSKIDKLKYLISATACNPVSKYPKESILIICYKIKI